MEVRKIRNICILAHVDHGKTTLADHLIAGAGGGVLHVKQAGKLRYLDYRDDEQQRAITMKSSSIALRFQGNLINLIDSPGHIDFCSEVSTATRLSDGALVLVDVCEGVHIQTHTVLRQAWIEHVKPCLVLNKIDRLITEIKLTPLEAYSRMQGIISEVNNIISGFRSEKYLSEVDSILAGPVDRSGQEMEAEHEQEDDDETDEFHPVKGNVAFSSAADGWAFRIDQFVGFYTAKLGASPTSLRKALWGNYFYSPKTKDIVRKKAAAGKLKPMFVQFVLEPLWQAYDAVMRGEEGSELLTKIIRSMHLVVPPRDLLHKDSKVVLQAVMSRWLPLSDNILSMVVDVLPDPRVAQEERVFRLLPRRQVAASASAMAEIEAQVESVRKAVEICDDREQAPCVVFVSKMFAVPMDILPRYRSNGEVIVNLEEELNVGDSDSSNRECFLAFARVFSGVLSVGHKVFILSAVYDPLETERKALQMGRVEELYMMMGRGLEPRSNIRAGNVCAIRGLGQYILKSATLSSTELCLPFASMSFQAAPIVRVAVEPSDPANIGALSKGLKLLNKADPCVQVSLSSTGEHVISAAGEVHLEVCIKDLRERFACVDIQVSPPLVAFRETIAAEASEVQEARKQVQRDFVETSTPNGRCTVRVHVSRMPSPLVQVLDENADLLKKIISGRKMVQQVSETRGDPVKILRERMQDVVCDSDIVRRIWALGPRHVGANILVVPDENGIGNVHQVRGFPQVSEMIGLTVEESRRREGLSQVGAEAEGLESSVITGFQVATAAGPLCEEPVWGLVFTVETLISENGGANTEGDTSAKPFSGQVITAVKEACRLAMNSKGPRLVEAMYLCEVITTAQYLGQMYGVLGRRRARVLKEEMREGTDMFVVHCFMPVSESFGFADEVRRKTSGAASPQLMLSHWEAIPQDPYFVPKSEEEVEEYGDGSSVPPNIARKLIDAVRRRKGLAVEEKVVQHATKQRTLARKV